jgi:hypothetical protein
MTYDIPKDNYLALLDDRIKCFGKQDENDDFQIMDLRASYDDEGYPLAEMKPFDDFIIRNAKALSDLECDNGLDHWIWNLDKVTNGSFPITDLPSHVRDIAKELYYGAGA